MKVNSSEIFCLPHMSSFEWADDSLSQIQIHFDLVLKSNVNFISFSIKTNLVYAKKERMRIDWGEGRSGCSRASCREGTLTHLCVAC